MTYNLASPFSNTFSKNVNPNSSINQTININPTIVIVNSTVATSPISTTNSKSNLVNGKSSINKDNSGVIGPITPADFTLANSIQISTSGAVDYQANIDVDIDADGVSQILGFSDEWTNSTETFGGKKIIGDVSIEDLANQDPNVIYDPIAQQLSFQDSMVGSTNINNCSSSTSGSVTLTQLTTDSSILGTVDRINNFGKVYDFQFKMVDFGQNPNGNASVCSSVANALGYVSFDKLLNDEVIRKNNIDALNAQCPSVNPPYNGFLVSPDYIASGWINIDELAVNDQGIIDESLALSIRTRKIVDSKRLIIKLLANYSSSIVELNSQNKLVDFGIRIKDTTTGQIYDYQNIRNGNAFAVGNQVGLTYTGTMNYGNPTTTNTTTQACSPCTQITQDKCTGEIISVANCVSQEVLAGISHEIMPQICLNPLINTSGAPADFTNTIDPIQWTTGIQNISNYQTIFADLIKEFGIDNYNINHLNVPRAFHYANGTSTQAYVCGGFFNSVLQPTQSQTLNNFSNVTAWNLIGSDEVNYEIAVPGGYNYNTSNAFTLYYEEEWNGNYWTVKNNTVIPTPKAMGIAGGFVDNEEKIIGFGIYDADFGSNGLVNVLYPTSQVWITTNGLWSHFNNGCYARVCPSGFLKTTTVTSSGAMQGGALSTQSVLPSILFSGDSNPSQFPNTPLQIDPITQLKIKDAMNSIGGSSNTTPQVTTNASSNIGIIFNGWIGAGGLSNGTGLGQPGSDINPFGLDRILDSEITNIFEYMQQTNVAFSTVSANSSSANNGVNLASTVNANVGWFVDTTRNYPIKTMGTLYLGDNNSGVATGGKTGVSINTNSPINAIDNILYSYNNDPRYSEFNNSIVNLVYSYDGTAWTRQDNLSECVAFHTGVGDVNHQIIYGGLHGSVELSDITVSYPGCDEWQQMIAAFGGTWHRFGTTGLDREKRYASFASLYQDSQKNTYYKVGDFRDTTKSGILYSAEYLSNGNIPDLSGVDWSTYVNSVSGHITQIAYADNNSEYPKYLDMSYFVGGESWSSPAVQFQTLDNFNPNLPYSEREAALDGVDQIGYFTKNVLTDNAIQYTESYKPDFNANPMASADGISSFPVSGYFANKDNFKNIVGKYQYAGHPTSGGMWLWSRPTAGEELFHPTNIFDNPQFYYDSCNIPHISGTWQNYESWIDQSFKTNIGLHSAVCWFDSIDCLTNQDSSFEQAQGFANVTKTNRNYRWTMGDFRYKANRLSPLGKEIGCLDINVSSDAQYLYNNGFISTCALISGGSTPALTGGTSFTYLYAWNVKNNFSRLVLCPVSTPIPHYVGYTQSPSGLMEVNVTGIVTDYATAISIAPSAEWPNYFDYVYQELTTFSSPIEGVFFLTGSPTESGLASPLLVDYNANFFATNSIYSAYPTYYISPTNDFVGFDTKSYTPIDYFNRAWFTPSSTPTSSFFSNINISEVFPHTCPTWWSNYAYFVSPTVGVTGFYYNNNYNALDLGQQYGYYTNSFDISGCSGITCSYGKDDNTTYWNFQLPQSQDIVRLNNLRDFYDTLSFGLPETYVVPTNFTYSFYITRDGVGLDQFFYSSSRNKFVERWKFPHSDVINDTMEFNGSNPYIVANDGSGQYVPLSDSNLFNFGTLSVGEIQYPTFISTSLENTVDGTAILNAIITMAQVQADTTSTRTANYFTNGSNNQTAVSCNFNSLGNWLNIAPDTSLPEKYSSHYYPMTYDNFNGPITGGPYFLPRGINQQSQFSIIPTAQSSAIRDRAALWPWCDLLQGCATNKPRFGDATWNWDSNGNLWTAEVIGVSQVVPTFCNDQTLNTDPLHRKLSPTTISTWYPNSYSRETYLIKCQDKFGNPIVSYQITYDEAAGEEIIGSKEGFDYNIFGTALLPRNIDLINYNNKPLSGPTQTWVAPFDEANSIHALNWRRTTLDGASGCPIDLYPYNRGTICEMISGGYYKHNIQNGLGYFCTIGSDQDTWVYSVPTGSTGLNLTNDNFFIQESPFAISAVSQGSAQGMITNVNALSGSGICLIEGFPPLTAICHDISGVCCYVVGTSGQCLSYDIESASYIYNANVCQLYVSSQTNISGYPCTTYQFIPASSVPLSSIGFNSFGYPAPSGFIPPYEVVGWTNCNQINGSYGSEIVRSYSYNTGSNVGALVSSAYITGPFSFGLGSMGIGKSNAMCGSLLYSGERAPCQYSQFSTSAITTKPLDANINQAWPWNIIGFEGLLGPTGYTDAIDNDGNYWIAIGDVNNTNPYTDVEFVSFGQNSFKNFYTIIKVDALNKSSFFNTVLARTNWKEVDGAQLNGLICLSDYFNLVNENIRGTRFREGIMEAINMSEGQRFYDFYVTLIQENNPNITTDPIINDKASYTPPTYVDNNLTVQISGAIVLPIEPLSTTPSVSAIQILDLVSQFDINCMSCYICDSSFVTNCPSASPWKQHNHEEWIAPYLSSPFAGPYSEQGFNIWLTAGGEPRWGVSLWSSVNNGKVWANYRRQRLHVNQYRNQLVLAQLTAAIAIDDFEAIAASTYGVTSTNQVAQVPVYVNYDEFIYCLDDYVDSKFVQTILNSQTSNSTNGVDCIDHVIASVNDTYLGNVSGGPLVKNINGSSCNTSTTPCSAFNIALLQNTNQGYVEWATSFIQEYRSSTSSACAPGTKYYFKYNLLNYSDSNTFLTTPCIVEDDIVPTQWRRYQDGVGLGGDAPAFNLFDNNTEFSCNSLDQWFIGQTAIGTTDAAVIVGGYAIASDGELHTSNCWWESPTFGVTFNWNTNVIQPEDTTNINYQKRTFSPFFASGNNAGANCTMGVTVFDMGSSTTVERQGSAVFNTNITTFNVVFPVPIPTYLPNNDKYSISMVCSDNVKLWWSNKTATGFTINAETTFAGYVDWSIYLEDTLPSSQVDGLDPQQTFEIFQES